MTTKDDNLTWWQALLITLALGALAGAGFILVDLWAGWRVL